jgi:hypothetical protein
MKPLDLNDSRGFLLEAGSENRTRINSLEGYGFTTKLCPHVQVGSDRLPVYKSILGYHKSVLL